MPVILAGDYNVMPTELDVYKPERRKGDQCSRLLWEQAGCLEGRDEELYFQAEKELMTGETRSSTSGRKL